jgi:hypothetical protein
VTRLSEADDVRRRLREARDDVAPGLADVGRHGALAAGDRQVLELQEDRIDDRARGLGVVLPIDLIDQQFVQGRIELRSQQLRIVAIDQSQAAPRIRRDRPQPGPPALEPRDVGRAGAFARRLELAVVARQTQLGRGQRVEPGRRIGDLLRELREPLMDRGLGARRRGGQRQRDGNAKGPAGIEQGAYAQELHDRGFQARPAPFRLASSRWAVQAASALGAPPASANK